MLYNILDSTVKRTICTCNYNQHICTTHPDRIMEEHDLIYIREGNWEIYQDDLAYTVGPGDAILLHSGYHHYGNLPCNGVVKTFFVHFSSTEKDRVGQALEHTSALYSFPIVVHCQDKPSIALCLSQLIHAYWSDDIYSRQMAAAYLDLCLCDLSRPAKSNTKNASLVEDIEQQITMTPERFISNTEFATKYGYSVRTISSKFKQYTGQSLHAWQMKVKCQMAHELMTYDSSLTLKEVASAYGFYDEYHFSKCYKKIYGCPPGRNHKK